MAMKSGKQLLLEAARRELKRLSLAAERAKRECDECMAAGSTMIELHREASDVLKTGKYDKESLAKVDDIDKRYRVANKAMKKDLVKLLDKHYEAQASVEELGREIAYLEVTFGLSKFDKK